jgi:ABC-type sugar transport system, permease component
MKQSISEKSFDIVNTVSLIIFSIMAFFPFYYVIIYSLSNPTEALKGVYLLPQKLDFVNYVQLFSKQNILHAAFISLSRTIIGTIATLFCCSLFAYGVSKEILPFRKFMYRATIITMYISPGLIPWYITMKAYGLKNNYLLYILPLIMVPFFIVLIKTYFEQLPEAIEESAMIDGANYFTIFWHVIFPISKPILATVGIFNAVNQWNAWTDNLYLCSSESLQTLQLLLYNFLNEQSAKLVLTDSSALNRIGRVTPTSIRMTITVIVTLPILIVYPFLQKYFLKGLLIGAIKG